MKEWFKKIFCRKKKDAPKLDLELVENLLKGIRLCTANPTTRNVKARERHFEELADVLSVYVRDLKAYEKGEIR
jgi:hypothetical protein